MHITEQEREILRQWVSGADLSKVKIKTGKLAEVLCCILGAQAVTLGHSIFITKNSWIAINPEGHPIRLSLLVHELYHVEHQEKIGLGRYLLQYVPVTVWLIFCGVVAKKSFKPVTLASYVGEHHPFEKPAYAIQNKFLQKHWTEEEASKWEQKS